MLSFLILMCDTQEVGDTLFHAAIQKEVLMGGCFKVILVSRYVQLLPSGKGACVQLIQ